MAPYPKNPAFLFFRNFGFHLDLSAAAASNQRTFGLKGKSLIRSDKRSLSTTSKTIENNYFHSDFFFAFRMSRVSQHEAGISFKYDPLLCLQIFFWFHSLRMCYINLNINYKEIVFDHNFLLFSI